MEILVNKQDLQKALTLLQSLTERKTTMPILSNIMIVAENNTLRFSATDLEIACVVNMDCKVVKPGKTAVSGKILSEIVKELSDTDVKIVLKDGTRVKISTSSSNFSINCSNPEEFPSLPGISLNAVSKISVIQLKEMIDSTLYAVSYDETRFVLNGVCFECTPEKKGGSTFRFVATDGHRLAMNTKKVETAKISERIVVPRRGLVEIKKILDYEVKPEVGFDVREGFLIIEGVNTKIAIRLIDGEFPDYEQVFPKEDGTIAVVDRDSITQALRRAALVVIDKGKRVSFFVDNNSIKISGVSAELGEANEEVKASYKGQSLKVGINARYLLDVLSSYYENCDVNIKFHGDLGPIKLWKKGDEESIAVIMPMRLD